MSATNNVQGKITAAIRQHAQHGKTESEKYQILAGLLGISESEVIFLFVYGRFPERTTEESCKEAHKKLNALLPAKKERHLTQSYDEYLYPLHLRDVL